MRLETEAFNYIPIPGWIIGCVLLLVLAAIVYLYNWSKGMSTGLKVTCWTVVYTGLLVLLSCTVVNQAAVADAEVLTNDLKDQLGIEKVSFDSEYRELTGEQHSRIVFCVLTEEGEKGDIYEVICK